MPSVTEEARHFAETVAGVVARHADGDPWLPGAAVSDGGPALDDALADAGFAELGTDPALAGVAGPAGLALGKALGSMRAIDRLLGGALRAGDLVRYAEPGVPLVAPRAGALEVSRGGELEPIPYADALGVARVTGGAPSGAVTGSEARIRMNAWVATTVGYLAGVSQVALELALDHTRSRVAFGRPLAANETVQQTLADAATGTEGLRLLSGEEPSGCALAHAGDAAVRVVAACQQLTGALGFTLEFPMQRAQRRARSARVWSDAALSAWEDR